MLTKKYLTIKKLLTHLSNYDFFHKKMMVLSQMYLEIDKGFRFSYFSYENGETDFINKLSRHYKDNFVFFDVGAHIGTYTDIVIERFENYEGHLFDVTKDTFDKCVVRHGDNKDLKINNAALSNEVGEVEYRYYPDDPTRNGISGVRTEGSMDFKLMKAPCWTGDHYCKENNINHIHLLKIDAEGYDLHVLKGFDRMLSEGRIDVLQFEYNVKHSETHSMLGDYYAFLEEKGYFVGPIRQEGVYFKNFDFTQNGFENGPNFAACKPEFSSMLLNFKDGHDCCLSLNRDADIEKVTQIIESSSLRYSLDQLSAKVSTKKYSKKSIEDVLQRLNLVGLEEEKKKEYFRHIDFVLKRKKHCRDIEKERARLGYWGKDSNAPRYSICVSNYNMADTLERAMTSVIEQLDKTLYEVVVIDDGSKDDSVSVLEKLSQKYSNFRFMSLPRDSKRKLGETRNLSIRAARGEYVLLHIDADDEWEPYLQDFVVLFHKMEEAVHHDFLLAAQQTGMAKRDFLLSEGGYDNVYRCEDRNLMMKLAKKNQLMFLDYKAYRTRLARPIKKKIIKTIWDDCSHLIYDLRQNEPKWPFIKHALLMPFTGKRFSLISRCLRPVLIFPIYVITRFMEPIINPITRAEMHAYHEKNRGTYPEVMARLGKDSDLSFLSEEAQEIYSHKNTNIGFRCSK